MFIRLRFPRISLLALTQVTRLEFKLVTEKLQIPGQSFNWNWPQCDAKNVTGQLWNTTAKVSTKIGKGKHVNFWTKISDQQELLRRV